jgi:hypothetical protein
MSGLSDASGLSLTFTRPRALPDVLCIGEAGGDMAAWEALAPEITTAGALETVRFYDPAAPAGTKRILRARFVRPE